VKKILIVDGNSILNRAFFGVAPLSASDGTPTGAVFGFIKILKRHLDSLCPDMAAVAFDLAAPTFRHKMYDGYKANRSGMPDELAVQLPFAKTAAEGMGFTVLTCEGYEADDILGTVAAMASVRDAHAYILTGDKDSLQLISGYTSVILAKNKEDVFFDRSKFRLEYGIDPEQFVDVKALMGDSSDNIPGVRGIGEKTALKLIAAAGSLDSLYADLPAFSKGAVLEKLTAGHDDAFLSRDLARIDTTVPDLDPESIFVPMVLRKNILRNLLTRLELRRLMDSFDIEDDGCYCSFPAVSITVAPCVDCSAEDFLSIPAGDIPFGLTVNDSEAFLSVLFDGRVMSLSSSTESLSSLLPFFKSHNLICHDFKEIAKILLPLNVTPVCAFDTMLAAYLLSPGEGNYPIDRVSAKYIGTADIPAAQAVQMLYESLLPLLKESEMDRLLFDIEIPLALTLAEMELFGFAVDGDGIHEFTANLRAVGEALTEQIYMKAGTEFNLNSPKQLGEVLFDRLGLPSGRKTKTGYSTDAETLEKLRPYSDIVADILDYRQISKLCGTYGDSLVELSRGDGRIHTLFHQTGTATGRLSSSDPNMQNIPIRDQLGRELRRYFTASAPGRVLVDGDYSQIELRLLAELSGDEAMKNAFIAGEDVHRRTASQVFGIPYDEVTPDLRSRAKAVNFGIVYGIGAFSLSKDLKISRKTAEEYIASYLATYPKVGQFLKDSISHARTHGYTVTMFGRRRYIPEINERNKNMQAFGERVAMNSPVQGSAADIIKIAMVNVATALKKSGLDANLILQVHDELIIDCSEECAAEVTEILRHEMEEATKTDVPLSVEISTGYSWYDAK